MSYLHEQEYLTLARVRIAQGQHDPDASCLQDALYLLDRLLADAETKARMSSVLEILVLRALALDAQGNRTGALVILERALQGETMNKPIVFMFSCQGSQYFHMGKALYQSLATSFRTGSSN